jgi:hypothetical protein
MEKRIGNPTLANTGQSRNAGRKHMPRQAEHLSAPAPLNSMPGGMTPCSG